jgi:O-antigen ligase
MKTDRFFKLIILAIAVCLPVYSNLVPPLIILASLFWIAEPQRIPVGLRVMKNNRAVLALVFLFLIYAAGIIYSFNKEEGFQILETKLSLIIFPLILSTRLQDIRQDINTYLRFFIYGCLLSGLICFSWSLYCYLKPMYILIDGVEYDLGASYFYYNRLSPLIHPSYLSLYVNVALLSLYYLVAKGEIKLTLKWYMISLFFGAFVLLLSSKAGWLGLFLISMFIFISFLFKRKLVEGIIILIILGGMFYVFNISAPQYSQRITSATEAVVNAGSDEKPETGNDGTSSRILVWQAAAELLLTHPLFGTGTGDAKKAMLEKYKEKGMVTEFEHKLNSHNQFLNTSVALGFAGLICLLLCLGLPIFLSLRNINMLLWGFCILSGINFLFESMLETQAGVMFYAFFGTVLCYCFINNGSEKDPQINIL